MLGTETVAEIQRSSEGAEPYPSLTFSADAWENFASALERYEGGCTFQAFPRSQQWADAYFGGSMEPFDLSLVETASDIENTIEGFPEWGIEYRRWSEDGEEPSKDAPTHRAPLSAFATLYLY